MLDMFLSNADPAARETARWYPKNGNLSEYKKIKVQNMNESGRSYWVEGTNIYASRDTIVLRTRYPYPYAPEDDETHNLQHIFFRGKWYEITEVRDKDLPKLGLYRQKEYFISLIEVNYGSDFGYENVR